VEGDFFDNGKNLITTNDIMDVQYAHTIAKKIYLLELLNIPPKEYSAL
jgi:hypothetical protein